MRRRQILSEVNKPTVHYYPVGTECVTPGAIFPINLAHEIAPPKGQCPKCTRHIGRGLHFHQKACNGNLS